MFYTYGHYKPDGTLFYIGKGVNRRAWDVRRNAFWKNIVSKYGQPIVKIFSWWDKEQDALTHEKFLIETFRDLGFELANLSNGGEVGPTGMKHTSHTKQKMSLAKIGKPKTQAHKDNIKKAVNLRSADFWEKIKNSRNDLAAKRKASQARMSDKNAKFLGAIYCTNAKDNTVNVYNGTKELKDAGFTPQSVYLCVTGKRMSHKGCFFERCGPKNELHF